MLAQQRILGVIVVMLSCVILAFAGGCATKTAALPEATSTRSPKPTFTPCPPSLDPSATATAKPLPTSVPPTARPTQVPPTATPTEQATDTAIPTKAPTSVPPTAAPAVAAPKAASSTGSVAATPKGASLAYAPEFPPVGPASEPSGHDAHTNPLSGQHVDDPGRLQRRPVLIRIGNDNGARPHSGISQAEIVMEDLMDAWWITRLTAVFLQDEPQQAGPLRSARPFNIETLPAFDGVLVFSGASIGVNQLLAQHNFDLIHENLDGDLFYRSSQRSAPHNLYTSIQSVRERLRAQGKERGVDLRGWTFSSDCPAGQPATRVDIPYPKTSTVAWTWDAGAGVYRRWVQGAAYADLLSGQQVGCENVIVIYAKHWESDIVEDSRGSTSIGIALKGGEKVQIFRDGQMIEGYWWRQDAARLWQFIDQNGQHIPLKPGHSWIQFVPHTYSLGIQ